MTGLSSFLASPWKTSHEAYESSFLNIRPAPEFSTAEVAIASLYRCCGYPGVSENDVAKAGRAFDRESQRATGNQEGRISAQGWRTVLHGVLESPKQPKQSSKRFLQLTPIVPDVALYSGSARLAGNSWNPGALVQRVVQMGAPSGSASAELWQDIFSALTVNEDDDIWARWLQDEFTRRGRDAPTWRFGNFASFDTDLSVADKDVLRYPAKQFNLDLRAVLGAKAWMTRRQWISLLESVVRVAIVTHVLWLSMAGARVWRAAAASLGRGQSEGPFTEARVRSEMLSCDKPFLSYGNQALPGIRDLVSGYLESRLGINLLLWTINATGDERPLSSASAIARLLNSVASRREELVKGAIWDRFESLLSTHARIVTCRSGIGSNMIEFSRHTLGQRQTATAVLRGYDQGYFLRKRSESLNSPWILSLGPVAALALVHCCLSQSSGPRSIRRLSEHLSWYGLDIDVDDISNGELARTLRTLGVVLDSPDAESGMLLVRPFASSATQVTP